VAITGRSREYPQIFHFAFQVEDAGAFHLDAIAYQPTNDLSAAPRGLKGAKHGLPSRLAQ